MKIAFITTVFNEEKTIGRFLDSLLSQSKLPNEVIVVDGGSTDKTVERIKIYDLRFKKKQVTYKVITKKGNRSVGRNEAIQNAKSDIIACSDSGNILDRNWVKNITKPFTNKKVDVVAGYYKGKSETVFQKAVIPYALVMEDKVDPDNFLPATRSVAFRKSVWKKIGGFKEEYSHNEDYVFARELKDSGANIYFAKDAIVYWLPRNNLKQAFTMMWRFAYGDAEAGIFRSKVLLVFARYFIGLYFLILCVFYKSIPGVIAALIGVLFYCMWSIYKNYKYVKHKAGLLILPALQFTADAAVLSGTFMGIIRRVTTYPFLRVVFNHKFLLGVLLVYTTILLATLEWGIPNKFHPFPYHMDEWHQLQAVANTFRYGTPNTAGSANGTMFHFLLSGLYLAPFTVFQIIDPFSLQLENWFMREQIFKVLRLQTILFGVLAMITIYKIAGLLRLSKPLVLFLFTCTPIWLMLSGYFKYDIALMFWILLAFYFLFSFAKKPTLRNYLIAAIPSALAFAVKVSAAPMLLIYILAYFFFYPQWRRNLKYFLSGVLVYMSCLFLFGLPDTLFGRGNVLQYLYENIIQSPATTSNFQVHMNPFVYVITQHFPVIFGYGVCILFLLSIFIIFLQVKKKGLLKILKEQKIGLFLLISFAIFAVSLLPLQIWATGNRSLVLLPFIVLFIGYAFKISQQLNIKKGIVTLVLSLAIFIQLYTTFSWIYMKFIPSPQEISSHWINTNIPKGQLIGIENIPIYQQLPDTIAREFYYGQYNVRQNARFRYQVIDEKTKKLPAVIVLTNADVNDKLYKESSQKNLLRRMEKENYKKIAVFSPDLRFIRPIISDDDYYFSAMLASSLTTTVYRK